MSNISETFANQWFSATFQWIDGLLVEIKLTAERKACSSPQSPYGPQLSKIIENYARLEADMWPELPLDTSKLSTFSITVLDNLRRIPRGQWTTYGALAALSGSPRAARAVGGIMAKNPWPLLYPCHRVLAGGRGLGGFGPGIELKQTLLTLEKALFQG